MGVNGPCRVYEHKERATFSIHGGFYYQVKTLPDGRVGFRIDNDTTLASGTHVALRHEPEHIWSVEKLIEDYPDWKNRPLSEIINNNTFKVLSILYNRTRAKTGGQGGGDLYQTYTWAEKRDCQAWNLMTGFIRIQVWDKAGVAGFESMTQNPPGWPAQ